MKNNSLLNEIIATKDKWIQGGYLYELIYNERVYSTKIGDIKIIDDTFIVCGKEFNCGCSIEEKNIAVYNDDSIVVSKELSKWLVKSFSK